MTKWNMYQEQNKTKQKTLLFWWCLECIHSEIVCDQHNIKFIISFHPSKNTFDLLLWSYRSFLVYWKYSLNIAISIEIFNTSKITRISEYNKLLAEIKTYLVVCIFIPFSASSPCFLFRHLGDCCNLLAQFLNFGWVWISSAKYKMVILIMSFLLLYKI